MSTFKGTDSDLFTLAQRCANYLQALGNIGHTCALPGNHECKIFRGVSCSPLERMHPNMFSIDRTEIAQAHTDISANPS